MAILISAHQLTKAFAARPLFRGLTFAIESGERIGLIGPNGAGKSTLLRILASQTSPDEGTLSFQKGLRVGFLEQVPFFKDGLTVASAILQDTPEDAWESIGHANELMSRLSLSEPDAPVAKLSGGWKKRVALARELAKKPDLLLLDEPTNHLDVESILWLESFLASASFATITITHDRLFLQRVSNRILELDPRNPGGLLSVQGDYAAYLETKEQLLAAQERREVVLKNTLRRETEWLRRGAKARTTKQQARIQRAGDLKAEVEDVSQRNQNRSAQLDFQTAGKNPKKLLEARNIAKSAAGRQLFSEVDLLLTPGTRIGILGPNGCGKSTLIRTLLGQVEPDDGEVTRSEHLAVAYFEQNRETLDPEQTVAKTLCPLGDHVDYRGGRLHIRSYLDRFLFSQGQMDMAVGKLSGGEQSRLLLAKLMLQEANLLVLDEPTNDLDMATLNVLEECLLDYPGAILLVTHDRYFLDQIATRILAFGTAPQTQGTLTSFADLEQWEQWHHAQEAEAKEASKKAANAEKKAAPKKRKLSFKDQREFDLMEKTILEAEQRLEKLSADLESPELATDPLRMAQLTRTISQAQQEVERLYARWAELEHLASGRLDVE